MSYIKNAGYTFLYFSPQVQENVYPLLVVCIKEKFEFLNLIEADCFLEMTITFQRKALQPPSSCFKSKDMREKVFVQFLQLYFLISECVCR